MDWIVCGVAPNTVKRTEINLSVDQPLRALGQTGVNIFIEQNKSAFYRVSVKVFHLNQKT